MRLRTVTVDTPGWSRRRAGKGFTYLDLDGKRLPAVDADRCRALVIPPAWNEVWICPAPNGHLQAVGTDEAGRRQYLYHPQWRVQRDAAKFDHTVEVAARLPVARRRVVRDLRREGMPRDRACALAFRLLDLGVFRIGSDAYAEEYGSFGLTTLERQHVSLSGTTASFAFTGKSGQEQAISVVDRGAASALQVLLRRRGGSPRLLAWKDGRRWRDLDADDVNAYVKQRLGQEASAKDFRTWHGTVMAAVALAASEATSRTARKRAVSGAMKEVADLLGNTPTVARKSYVDPRVTDLYERGTTIAMTEVRGRGVAMREGVEKEVIALLTT